MAPEVQSAMTTPSVVAPAERERQWKRHIWRIALTDLAAIVTAEAAAIVLRLPWYGPEDALHWSARGVLVTAGLLVGWMWALRLMRTRDRRLIGAGPDEYSRVALATWWTFAVLGLVSFVFKLNLARSYVAIALPVGLVLLLVGRFVWRRALLRMRLRGELQAAVLVVGHRHRAEDLIRNLQEHVDIGYRPVAVCAPGAEYSRGDDVLGVPIVGDFSQVPALIEELGVDSVAVSGYDTVTADFVRRLGWSLEPTRTDLLLSSPLAEIAGPRIMTAPVPGARLVHVDAPRFSGPKYFVKSLVDTVAAAVLLAVSAPLMLGVAIAIKATSPGPVLYRQKRVGKDGRPFVMYKFRSMDTGADTRLDELAERSDGNALLFKMRDDPRVTRVGRWMRRLSVDEMPQLLNVLRGEMSLVGPRPPLESEVAKYDDAISRRLLVKPGMTGLWQVSGRSDLSLAESIRYDLYYVENWSIVGDLMILWRTIRAVVTGAGAY